MSDEKLTEKTPRKARTPKSTSASVKKKDEAQILPPEQEVQSVLNGVGGNIRGIMATLMATVGANQKRDSMSAIADSIVGSFDKYRTSMVNHISTKDVAFEIEMGASSVNSVLFTESVPGLKGNGGNALNVNIDYFDSLYRQKRDLNEPPKNLVDMNMWRINTM